MPDTLPNLGLPLLMPSQAQKHVTHNEALQVLDCVTQLRVIDSDRTLPPATSQDGDRHIVAVGATGSWTGHDFSIATYSNGSWRFDTP